MILLGFLSSVHKQQIFMDHQGEPNNKAIQFSGSCLQPIYSDIGDAVFSFSWDYHIILYIQTLHITVITRIICNILYMVILQYTARVSMAHDKR